MAPPVATGGAPRTAKVILSVGLGLAIVPRAMAHAPAAEFLPMVASLLEQILIGAGLGMLTRVLFSAVESAGTLLDMFGGFTAAAAYDPLQQRVHVDLRQVLRHPRHHPDLRHQRASADLPGIPAHVRRAAARRGACRSPASTTRSSAR